MNPEISSATLEFSLSRHSYRLLWVTFVDKGYVVRSLKLPIWDNIPMWARYDHMREEFPFAKLLKLSFIQSLLSLRVNILCPIILIIGMEVSIKTVELLIFGLECYVIDRLN